MQELRGVLAHAAHRPEMLLCWNTAAMLPHTQPSSVPALGRPAATATEAWSEATECNNDYGAEAHGHVPVSTVFEGKRSGAQSRSDDDAAFRHWEGDVAELGLYPSTDLLLRAMTSLCHRAKQSSK